MKVNYVARTIELTKKEMKEAQQYGSDMYNMLRDARNDNPGFAVKEIKTKAKKASEFANIDMKYIRTYVTAWGTDEQKEAFKEISKCHTNKKGESVMDESFFEIKKWFLSEFDLKKSGKSSNSKAVEIFEAAEVKAIKANKVAA